MTNLKLLLDENLSPSISVKLQGEGFDVVHVRDRGLNRATDREVLDAAYGEDRILVTANVRDFVLLASSRDLHAGIVLLENGELLRDEQEATVRRVLELILQQHEGGSDMINRTLRIGLRGEPFFNP